MQANIHNLLRNARPTFNIIEEFAALTPARKIALCDCLFVEGKESFQKTAKTLWSQAGATDMKKLENFLILLKGTAH
jgi:hypothetical protein